MPPKKSTAQASSSQTCTQQRSRQTRSASRQPSIESPKPLRRGRKRTHSDASNTSEQLAEAQPALATPLKCHKKVKITAGSLVEHERLQEVVEEDEELLTSALSTDAAESIELSLTKNVHFDTPKDSANDAISSEDPESTAFHITPYPNKLLIKRGITTSPRPGNSEAKRMKRTSIRHSLPPSLTQRQEGQIMYIAEREFARLDDILPERKQQLACAYKLLQELSQERLNNNTSRVQEIEHELEQLEDERKSLAAYFGSNLDMLCEDDEETFVLTSQEETECPPELPQAPSQEILLRSSQTRSQEDAWKGEREQLKEMLLALSRESNEATTKLEILKCEVEALNFGEAGTSASAVMQTIRDSMSGIRDSLKEILVDAVPEGASNDDLLDIVVALLKEYASQLRLQDHELSKSSKLNTDFGKQNKYLFNRLVNTEFFRDKLQESWNDLDLQIDEKRREIAELQEDLDDTTNQRDALEEDIEAKLDEGQALKDENIELGKNIDRLTAALQGYREEEDRLMNSITKMQVEQQTTVGKMNQEREKTVRDLEDRMDEQSRLRAEAEKEAAERQATMISLDLKIEQLETERDRSHNELANVTALRDQEQDARKAAEADLEESSAKVDELEERVTQLEEDLEMLNTQIAELREISETERTQREAAESDLNDRNSELEELKRKLLSQGTEANALRLKLFEVQQQHEQTIQELEDLASDRDEQYQADIAQEVERRENAQELVQRHAETIKQLEIRLEQVEQEMRISLTERDKSIEVLEQQLDQKDRELETLRDNLHNAEDLYDAHVKKADEKRQELEASISTLQVTISEREEQITSQREEAATLVDTHDSETQHRNAEIAELNHAVAKYKVVVADLTREKTSLERRVEQEAEQMLEFQNEKEDEIGALKATIWDNHTNICNIEEKALAADLRWQELVAGREEDIVARDEEINALRAENEEYKETISALTCDNEALRRKFREYVHRTNMKQKMAKNEAAASAALVARTVVEIEEDGEQVLREMDAMDVFAQATVVTTTHNQKKEHATRKSSGRKKRVVDSGIGMDGEGETLMVE